MDQLAFPVVAEATVLPYAATRRQTAQGYPLESIATLSDTDLISCLLDLPSQALPGPSVIAESLLGGSPSARGLVELLDLTPQHLVRLGLSAAAGSRLLAALEIARRLARGMVPESQPLASPGDVARYLFLRYARIDQEVFGAVLLDSGSRWIADLELARGTYSRISVEPRHVLAAALLRGATGFVLFHNHPSTNPAPSGEDYEITRLFQLAGEAVGVRLVDHLVLGSATSWLSIRDRRPW